MYHFVCVHACVQENVWIHGKSEVSPRHHSSGTVYLVFWVRISHWTYNSPSKLGWLTIRTQGTGLYQPCQNWEDRHVPPCLVLDMDFEDKIQVLTLEQQTLYWLSYLYRCIYTIVLKGKPTTLTQKLMGLPFCQLLTRNKTPQRKFNLVPNPIYYLLTDESTW